MILSGSYLEGIMYSCSNDVKGISIRIIIAKAPVQGQRSGGKS